MATRKSKSTSLRRLTTKVKAADSLKRILSGLKKNKKKIVFTNGCFDILHRGHVTYLEQARRLGDVLVVGINDDQSVSRAKGPERPINRLAERIEVIAALESVDFVTWFEEDTPVELIRKLQPSIHVKGGDWKIEQMPEAPVIQAYGGKIVLIPYLEGLSTTRIIEKTRRRPGT